MKKIFLMRHSIPEKGDMPNEQIPLSEEGKALAVSKRNIFSNVDRCFSSPYRRAVHSIYGSPECNDRCWIAVNAEILCDLVICSLYKSFVRCHGWLGHLGNCEWRTEADHRVHRERNYDGAIFSSSDVDVRREDRKQLEEDTVV